MRRTSMVVALVVAVASMGACGGDDDAASAAGGGLGGTLRVLAAASLTDAFTELADRFEDDHPGVDVQLDLGGSSSLREQVLEGAPADVVATASEPTMADLVGAGAVDEPSTFATNRLQIAVPPGNPAGIEGLADFDDAELLLGTCAPEVPCGELARRALDEAGVEASIDTEEPDVRALLTKVEAGELDAGIVYVSDVASAGGAVEGIEVPTDDLVAVYPIAVTADAGNRPAAVAFVDLVRSDTGQQVLRGAGFGPP